MPHSRARQAHTLLTATACAETPGYPRSHRRLLCGGPARTGRRASAGRKYLGSIRTTVSPARSPPATFPTSATDPCSPSHLRRRGGRGRRPRRRATRRAGGWGLRLTCRRQAPHLECHALPAARPSRSPLADAPTKAGGSVQQPGPRRAAHSPCPSGSTRQLAVLWPRGAAHLIGSPARSNAISTKRRTVVVSPVATT